MKTVNDKTFLIILLVLLAFLNISTVVISRRAADYSKTAVISSRCSVKTLLSYPPPISQDNADEIFLEYDKCIKGGG